MVAEKKFDNLTNEEIMDYLNKSDLMHISENRQTKSIYFKDTNENISCIIYTLTYPDATILANINGLKINRLLPRKDFYEIFNKYKIFIMK